jgi:ribosomal-protein-alanine N-acetyltransferase
MPFPVAIETPRLRIREFKAGDEEAINEYASDPETVKFMDWGPNTIEETRGFARERLAAREKQPRLDYTLFIELKETGKLIGACDLTLNPRQPVAFMGYCLNRSYWNKGFATEAARALADFGFSELGLVRIWATCDTVNAASARVLEKAGMRREGHLRKERMVKGRWRDSYVYAILCEEWEKERS